MLKVLTRAHYRKLNEVEEVKELGTRVSTNFRPDQLRLVEIPKKYINYGFPMCYEYYYNEIDSWISRTHTVIPKKCFIILLDTIRLVAFKYKIPACVGGSRSSGEADRKARNASILTELI